MVVHKEKRAAWASAVPWITALALWPMGLASAAQLVEGCEFTEAAPPFLLAQAAAPTAQRNPNAPPATGEPNRVPVTTSPELLRPPQEQELKPLGDVLAALADPKTSAATLAALGEGRPFSMDRYLVLVGDVRSILLYVQAAELRARLNKNDAIKADTRAWLEPRIGIMETCAPARFADRGGNESFQKSVELIRKQRGALQPLVFQTVAAPSNVAKPTAVQAPPTERTGTPR